MDLVKLFKFDSQDLKDTTYKNNHSVIEITMGPELSVKIIHLHKGLFLVLRWL